ncbi:MAG: Hsp20/alpha crystallin family protein [Hyphomicrobiaceae bacterium]
MAQEIKKTETGAMPVHRYMDQFSAMRSEMDRVFDSFLGRGIGRFPAFARGEDSDAVVPSIDVRETETELVVEAELPGMDEKDISVTLNNGVLTLKGEKKSEREEKKDDYHLMERSYGSFQRSFEVADTIDADEVKAAFEKGVLKVTLPKRPEAVKSEKRIPIGKA